MDGEGYDKVLKYIPNLSNTTEITWNDLSHTSLKWTSSKPTMIAHIFSITVGSDFDP
jgi:hypothetical protein